jgi:Flp pilus assembly protein TadG
MPAGGAPRVRRRRHRQRGQVLPLVALLMVVLTGFAALAIDTGVAYDQSRTQQDAADAASLAATWYIYNNENNQSATLGDAYAAAQNVASMDCTGPSAPCPITMNFYGSSWTPSTPGTALCSASTQTAANGCSTALGSVAYAGVSIGGTGHNYFEGLDPVRSRTFNISNQAVAQVVGGSTTGDDGDEFLSCVLCILNPASGAGPQGVAGLTIPSGVKDLDLTTNGANIYINGGFSCASGDTVTINSTSSTGNGTVDISGTYSHGCTATWDPSGNPTTGTQPVPDPLATMTMPAVNTYTSCTASITITTTQSLSPGCYGNITIDSPAGSSNNGQRGTNCLAPGDGIIVTFNSGLYIIYGKLLIEGDDPTVASEVCDTANGGNTLDFVCPNANDTGPAECGTEPNDQGQPTAGGELDLDPTCDQEGAYQWNLFPSTSGAQANMVLLYDRLNDSPILTTSECADPDSDHNGGIYAKNATYETVNYGDSQGDSTALGSPVVVGYMSLGTNYSGSDGFQTPAFALDNDVQVPAGGPGGLVS